MTADFFTSCNAAGTELYWTVSGLSSGDALVFHIRYEPNDDNAHYRRFPSEGTYTAYDSIYDFTCSIEPGQSYAVRIEVNGEFSALQYFTAPSGGRPENWDWSPYIWSGAPLENLTAYVWNQFTERIDAFRAYKGAGAYGFTTAVSGQTPLITLFTEAEAAINGISGHGTVPTSRELAMTYFNALAAALNAVP